MPTGLLLFLAIIPIFFSFIFLSERQFKVMGYCISVSIFFILWLILGTRHITYTEKEFKVVNVNGTQWCMDDPPFNLNKTFGKKFDGDTVILTERRGEFGVCYDGYILGKEK